jgi:hypothetical protein
MSCAVVCQPTIEIRMAALPRNVLDDRGRDRVVAGEAHEHLIEHDVVEDLHAVSSEVKPP